MNRSLLFAIAIGFQALLQASASPPSSSPMSLEICPLLREKGVPGSAIAVFAKSRVQYVFCGERNALVKAPVTQDTVFEAASLGKPIFAFAVLRLASDHGIDLDAPLSRYLTGKTVHDRDPFNHRGTTDPVLPEFLSSLTPRMILDHTTGLPNWMPEKPLAVTGRPGTWQYSGEGYVLLQRAVEKITGEPLDVWMEHVVFKPLGMRDSSFRWNPRLGGKEAIGHDEHGQALSVDHFPYPLAPTSLYTTIKDYATFVRFAFLDYGTSNLFTQTTVAVNAGHHLYWGEGVGIEKLGEREYFLHGGSNPGFRNYLWLDAKSGHGFLFFSDGDNGYALVRPLVDLLLPGEHPALTASELHLP